MTEARPDYDPSAPAYRETAPPPLLARHLVCTWSRIVGPAGPGRAQRILPDGCADIIWIGDSDPVIVGPATRVAVARLAPGTVVVGARLRPGTAPALLDFPADLILDGTAPLRESWGGETDRLSDAIRQATGAEARRRVLERLLIGRVAAAPSPDRAMTAAAEWLARIPQGQVREARLATGLSERQVHRRFRAAVGYAPKTFQRIARFQRLLALAERWGAGNRADLAAASGYADQAHMTREIRRLSGRTPTALLTRARSTLGLGDPLDGLRDRAAG